MDQNPLVLDISSDEEPSFEEPRGEDYKWLSELLKEGMDDSDDVVVVGETKSKSSKSAVDDGDDDDCVILDGDPEKPVDVVNDKASEEDDVVIVGQKGQVACRDYPHPRHLCAKYPFSSSAHNVHCDLCHCYVCDSHAPCALWGTGVSNMDHCHATEKDEFWESLRKNIRVQKQVPPPVEKVPVSLPSMPCPRRNHTIPTLFRACTSTRVTTPGIITNGRSQHSGPIFARNGYQPRLVAQQLPHLRVRNTVIRKETGINVGNLGIRVPGRAGIAGSVLQSDQSLCGSVNNSRGGLAPFPVPKTHVNQNSSAYQRTSQTVIGSGFMSTLPLESQLYVQPVSEFQDYNLPITQLPVFSQPTPEPPACSEHISQPNVQNSNDFANQIQSTAELDFDDFEKWLTDNSQSNQQPPVENFQLQRTGSTYEQLPCEKIDSQCNNQTPPALPNIPLQESNFQCNGTDKMNYNDLGIENWFLGDQSTTEVVPGGFVVPSDLDPVLPATPASFDVGMLLFDFETSFNALANV